MWVYDGIATWKQGAVSRDTVPCLVKVGNFLSGTPGQEECA